jgi:hypothetical protein
LKRERKRKGSELGLRVEEVEVEDPESAKHESGEFKRLKQLKWLKLKIPGVRSTNREG